MGGISDGRLFRQTLVVAAAIGFAIILWRLTDLILLLIAGSLVAFIFFQFAQWIQNRLKLPFAVALTLAVVVPLAFLMFVFFAFGSMLASQFAILFDQLPDAFAFAQDWLRNSPLGREVMARMGSFMPDGSRIVSIIQLVVANIGTALTGLVVVLVAGVYLAAQPRLYGRGVLALVPPHARPRTVSTVKAVVEAISAWLKAQAISMAFVGLFTGVALSIVGLPAAPAIGLVAGICEFVPYLGTIVVAIPAVILGFSESTDKGLWTIVALVIVQQVQGNIVTPLVQSRMAELPPALTIFSLIAAGVLLGPMGVILAVPLTVLGQVLVKELVHYQAPRQVEEAVADLPEG